MQKNDHTSPINCSSDNEFHVFTLGCLQNELISGIERKILNLTISETHKFPLFHLKQTYTRAL